MQKILNLKIPTPIIYSIILVIAIYLSTIMYQKYTSKNLTLEQAINLKQNKSMNKENLTQEELEKNYSKIVFAGGCFWCTESEFNHLEGVVTAISGYADSAKENPSYAEVGSGDVRAREAVLVYYNSASTTLNNLLAKYWRHIDPTDAYGQFADQGYQYTTAIYYTNDEQKLAIEKSKLETQDYIDNNPKFLTKKIVTEILPYNNFYPAEEYHQDYKDKNPVRYELYRDGSGRNDFIKLHWQDGSTTKVNRVENVSSNLNENKNVKSWENFAPQIKNEKLKTLSAISLKVTQDSGTEKPFSNGNYNDNKEVGLYVDIVSGEPLFLSKDKYDSGTGWPSFVKPISEYAVTFHVDDGIFSTRTEVRSKIADSHLGHVFEDGPSDRGGKRYCMNGAAMKFIPLTDMEKGAYGEYTSLLK